MCQPAEEKNTKRDSYLHLCEVLLHRGFIACSILCQDVEVTQKHFLTAQLPNKWPWDSWSFPVTGDTQAQPGQALSREAKKGLIYHMVVVRRG